MTDVELQAIRDRYASYDADRKRLANGLDVAVSDIDALLEHVASLTAERDALQVDKELIDQALSNLPGQIRRLVVTEYQRLASASRKSPQIT